MRTLTECWPRGSCNSVGVRFPVGFPSRSICAFGGLLFTLSWAVSLLVVAFSRFTNADEELLSPASLFVASSPRVPALLVGALSGGGIAGAIGAVVDPLWLRFVLRSDSAGDLRS